MNLRAISAIFGLAFVNFFGCSDNNTSDESNCYAGLQCITRTVSELNYSSNVCTDTDPQTGIPYNTPNIGCQTMRSAEAAYEHDILNNKIKKVYLKVGKTCSPCIPNAQNISASLSLQGNPTCPVTTTHTRTYETPGCWCNITFVGRRCCFCIGGCYTTETWTTTEYVPAPAYGPCP